jgi:hypothetical protein
MRLGFQSVNLTAQFYGTAIYSTGTSPWEHALANCASVCQVNQEQEIRMVQLKPKQMEQQ